MMQQTTDLTLADVLHTSAKLYSALSAITAQGRLPLTYEGLYAHIAETMQVLNGWGIGRNDLCVVVLPNSVEATVAILSVKSAATCITINPAWTSAEMLNVLSRLKVKAVIIAADLETVAWQTGEKLSLPIITLVPLPNKEAGLFRLFSKDFRNLAIRGDSIHGGFAQPDDIVQLVLTSGTEAAPKIVPYIHRKAFAHTRLIGGLIGLSSQDRLLSFLPIHHLIGMGYIQQALMFGGSVYVLPGFDVKTFFESLKEVQPTWFAAVTPMYQAMLDHASQYTDALANLSVRCMVAPSIAIDAARSAELEQIFKAPLIQTYGSTEVAHVSVNPMPGLVRKRGSAGIPSTEIAMIDDDLKFLPRGATGEIVVRGSAVMEAYEGDPDATARAFINGWYRMGDLGYLDEDGYLFIVGRVKEVI